MLLTSNKLVTEGFIKYKIRFPNTTKEEKLRVLIYDLFFSFIVDEKKNSERTCAVYSVRRQDRVKKQYDVTNFKVL